MPPGIARSSNAQFIEKLLASATRQRSLPTASAEDKFHCLLLGVREEVSVTAAHVLGRMADARHR